MLCAGQISTGGKTMSLGDHDSEADAARAFDRAAIGRHGSNARTNFDIDDYKAELDELRRKPTPLSAASCLCLPCS